jgi:hypothetical protein
VFILGVLGFFAANTAVTKSLQLRIGLVAGYVVFASINLYVIYQVEIERRVMEAYIDDKLLTEKDLGSLPSLKKQIKTPSTGVVYECT